MSERIKDFSTNDSTLTSYQKLQQQDRYSHLSSQRQLRAIQEKNQSFSNLFKDNQILINAEKKYNQPQQSMNSKSFQYSFLQDYKEKYEFQASPSSPDLFDHQIQFTQEKERFNDHFLFPSKQKTEISQIEIQNLQFLAEQALKADQRIFLMNHNLSDFSKCFQRSYFTQYIYFKDSAEQKSLNYYEHQYLSILNQNPQQSQIGDSIEYIQIKQDDLLKRLAKLRDKKNQLSNEVLSHLRAYRYLQTVERGISQEEEKIYQILFTKNFAEKQKILFQQQMNEVSPKQEGEGSFEKLNLSYLEEINNKRQNYYQFSQKQQQQYLESIKIEVENDDNNNENVKKQNDEMNNMEQKLLLMQKNNNGLESQSYSNDQQIQMNQQVNLSSDYLHSQNKINQNNDNNNITISESANNEEKSNKSTKNNHQFKEQNHFRSRKNEAQRRIKFVSLGDKKNTQLHNHLKIFMLESIKYVLQFLQTHSFAKVIEKIPFLYQDQQKYTSSTLKQYYLNYLQNFKQRYRKSDFVHFVKEFRPFLKKQLIQVSEQNSQENLTNQSNNKKFEIRNAQYLFIILNSFMMKQVNEILGGKENASNLLSSDNLDLIEYLIQNEQALDSVNNLIKLVNAFNSANRQFLLQFCLFECNLKACRKKANKIDQFYIKSYILQVLKNPELME